MSEAPQRGEFAFVRMTVADQAADNAAAKAVVLTLDPADERVHGLERLRLQFDLSAHRAESSSRTEV